MRVAIDEEAVPGALVPTQSSHLSSDSPAQKSELPEGVLIAIPGSPSQMSTAPSTSQSGITDDDATASQSVTQGQTSGTDSKLLNKGAIPSNSLQLPDVALASEQEKPGTQMHADVQRQTEEQTPIDAQSHDNGEKHHAEAASSSHEAARRAEGLSDAQGRLKASLLCIVPSQMQTLCAEVCCMIVGYLHVWQLAVHSHLLLLATLTGHREVRPMLSS